MLHRSAVSFWRAYRRSPFTSGMWKYMEKHYTAGRVCTATSTSIAAILRYLIHTFLECSVILASVSPESFHIGDVEVYGETLHRWKSLYGNKYIHCRDTPVFDTYVFVRGTRHQNSCGFIRSLRPSGSLEVSRTQSLSLGTRRHHLCRRSQAEEIVMSPPQPAIHGMPRRFLSGVRLECKPVPVRYSSSIHLKIGSTKRRYTEKVFYQLRLVPIGFFEGATADFCHVANPGARRFIATMTLQCTNVPHIRLSQPDDGDTDA